MAILEEKIVAYANARVQKKRLDCGPLSQHSSRSITTQSRSRYDMFLPHVSSMLIVYPVAIELRTQGKCCSCGPTDVTDTAVAATF